MIEIDGELFEDPCEIRKRERIVALVEIATKTTMSCLRSIADKQPIEIRELIARIGQCQIGIIMSQPLWEPTGGEIVRLPEFATGGMVVPPVPDALRAKTYIFDPMDGMVIGVDPGSPDGDKSVDFRPVIIDEFGTVGMVRGRSDYEQILYDSEK